MVELISREEHEKLYLQLYEVLKRKIESGEWSPGTQIPTEKQLCKIFNVSRITVRNALLELVRQGYLIRQQGKGTFVSKNLPTEGLMMTTFFKKLWIEDESRLNKRVLAKTVIMPVDGLSQELNISQDKHVIYIKILWQIGENPSILQESFIPVEVCPQLIEEDIEAQSLIELFEKKYSIKITKVDVYFEINSLNKEFAKVLKTNKGDPAILMIQKIFSGDTIVLLNKFYKKDDNNKFFITLQRKTI